MANAAPGIEQSLIKTAIWKLGLCIWYFETIKGSQRQHCVHCDLKFLIIHLISLPAFIKYQITTNK